MKSAEAGAINTTDVLNIKNEYLNPRHSDFKHTNAWALFNASTEILKKAPKQLAAKSIKLHEVYDEFCSVWLQYRKAIKILCNKSNYDQTEISRALDKVNSHKQISRCKHCGAIKHDTNKTPCFRCLTHHAHHMHKYYDIN